MMILWMVTLIQPWPVQVMVRMRTMVATALTITEVVKESSPDSPRESSTSRLQLSKVVTIALTNGQSQSIHKHFL